MFVVVQPHSVKTASGSVAADRKSRSDFRQQLRAASIAFCFRVQIAQEHCSEVGVPMSVGVHLSDGERFMSQRMGLSVVNLIVKLLSKPFPFRRTFASNHRLNLVLRPHLQPFGYSPCNHGRFEDCQSREYHPFEGDIADGILFAWAVYHNLAVLDFFAWAIAEQDQAIGHHSWFACEKFDIMRGQGICRWGSGDSQRHFHRPHSVCLWPIEARSKPVRRSLVWFASLRARGQCIHVWTAHSCFHLGGTSSQRSRRSVLVWFERFRAGWTSF